MIKPPSAFTAPAWEAPKVGDTILMTIPERGWRGLLVRLGLRKPAGPREFICTHIAGGE